jgi:hypothetical protein
MEKEKIAVATIFIIAVLSAIIIAFPNKGVGETLQGARIYVDPPTVTEEARQPPFTFQVYMAVYNVSNMVYCEFNMSYTPGIFVVNQIFKLKVQGQYPSLYTDVDDLKGYVYARLTYSQPITLAGETAKLLEVEFTAENYGFTALDLHDVLIKDKDGKAVSCDVGDGYVSIIKHDIAVTGCSASTNATYVGRLVDVNVIVENEGNVAENVTVKVYADNQLIATLSASLGPNEMVTLTATWNTSSWAPSLTPRRLKAEAEAVPYEVSLENNVFTDGNVTLKIAGDVNGDGAVDIKDLELWDAAYGSKPGDPNWNPQADINGDNIVDKEDGILIIQNYKSSLQP